MAKGVGLGQRAGVGVHLAALDVVLPRPSRGTIGLSDAEVVDQEREFASFDSPEPRSGGEGEVKGDDGRGYRLLGQAK